MNVAIFEQEERFGCGITSQKTLKGFNRGLLAKATNGAAFLQTPLLVNTDIGWNDSHGIQMIVDPFNNPVSSGRAMHAGSFDVDSIRDAHARPGRSNASSASARTSANSGEVSVTIRLNGLLTPTAP